VLALIGWLGFINAMLFVFNIIPAFPLDGGRIARAVIWWRTGDRNRATVATGRSGQALALALGLFGLWEFASRGSSLGLVTMVLAFFLYQAAGAAVLQGALGRRIQHITVADIMDREPVTIPAGATLLDADRLFERYRDLRKRDGVWVEKGVDVALAIELISLAYLEGADRVVVVSSDTDLVPTLELARSIRGDNFAEVAGWDGPHPSAAVLSVEGVPQHPLDQTDFERLQDHTNYTLNIRVRKRQGDGGWGAQIDAEGKRPRGH
jgi:CBS domain-containing protein